MHRTDLVIVGSYAVGLTMRAERAPVAGETVLGKEFDEGPGGKGSNQAVQAARMGASVALVAAVGRDRFGDDAIALWGREHVATESVSRVDMPTGAGFIIVDDAGENRIILFAGANAELDATAVGRAVAQRRPTVVVTQLEIPLDCVAAALEAAERSGATAVLNPAPAQYGAMDASLLRRADVLTPNQSEARILVGRAPDDDAVDDEHVAHELLARGVRSVVMTRGAAGAIICSASEGTTVVPAPSISVVDTTGAGDAFNGAFAAVLAQGGGQLAAARVGVRAGALACTRLGVVPSLPTRDRLDLTARSTVVPGASRTPSAAAT